MTELRQIKGYNGKYYASSDGHIYSEYKKGYLYEDTSSGYKRVKLHLNGKDVNKLVHILVAEAFDISSVDGGYENVNHKDENKENNSPSNLEYCKAKYNQDYGTRKERISKTLKETKEGKPVICIELNKEFRTIHEAARELGLTANGIWNALNGRAKSCGTYHWTYKKN